MTVLSAHFIQIHKILALETWVMLRHHAKKSALKKCFGRFSVISCWREIQTKLGPHLKRMVSTLPHGKEFCKNLNFQESYGVLNKGGVAPFFGQKNCAISNFKVRYLKKYYRYSYFTDISGKFGSFWVQNWYRTLKLLYSKPSYELLKFFFENSKNAQFWELFIFKYLFKTHIVTKV